MKSIFSVLIFLLSVIYLPAQNIGINNPDPGSTLSINGSMSAGYNNVTSNYSLTGDDYFVVYNGTANASFYLPAPRHPAAATLKGVFIK